MYANNLMRTDGKNRDIGCISIEEQRSRYLPGLRAGPLWFLLASFVDLESENLKQKKSPCVLTSVFVLN